ncbi:MAG: sulfate reduction electron transfer complex DsrMKJOP subunit DsrJ [Acidobacteriota bacterium]
MYDAGKIVPGLVIFLALVTLPFWYNAAMGKTAYKPEPKLPTTEKQCIESREVMIDTHMDMIYQWRDKVVREGQRDHTASDGKVYKMSLTGTCMKCHTSKVQFCDQCHNYMDVKPYCWDCHNAPKENQ